jgi:branched-chain amino acid transport system ATP-binding protein
MALEGTGPPLLTIRNLSRTFGGVRAVDDLSLDIVPGEVTALIGPNGAGKTTALNAVAGFLPNGRGSIHFLGTEITKAKPDAIARLGIGRTFQDCKIFPQLSVLDNVMLGLRDGRNESWTSAMLRRHSLAISEKDKSERSAALLDQVGLLDRKAALAGELSYGQRKLLELCRVMALQPRLVLLDEPMAGLFPSMIDTMMTMIRKLHASGMTVLFIEHNMRVVMELSRRVLVLNFGELIADGSPESVRSDPAVRTAYLGRSAYNAP